MGISHRDGDHVVGLVSSLKKSGIGRWGKWNEGGAHGWNPHVDGHRKSFTSIRVFPGAFKKSRSRMYLELRSAISQFSYGEVNEASETVSAHFRDTAVPVDDRHLQSVVLGVNGRQDDPIRTNPMSPFRDLFGPCSPWIQVFEA